MIERLKLLRKSLKLSQKNFGEKIGLKPSSYSDIENGRAKLTDRNISLIGERFGVNEEWLKNGVGEMFSPTNKPLIEQLKEELNLTNFQYGMIKEFLALKPEQQDAIKTYARSLLQYADDEPINDETKLELSADINPLNEESKKALAAYELELIAEQKGTISPASTASPLNNAQSKIKKAN